MGKKIIRKPKNEIEAELSKIKWQYRKYFRWKFNLPYQGRKNKAETIEDLCRFCYVKNPEFFYDWEKSREYNHLVNIYLESKAANDLSEVYSLMVEKAKTGDPKAVEVMLKLQKEIKASIRQQREKEKEINEDDGLEV